jgi:uncharacterized protein YeaO (DUF488 family)
MKVKNFLIILLTIIVSGCSSQFVYKNLDWLAHWYIDDYIVLTAEQKVTVDNKLTAWLEWHQQEELPRYLASLNELTTDINSQQLSFEKLTIHETAIKQHWARMKAKIVPDLVQLAPLLDEQQVAYLFKKLDQRNSKEREEIDAYLALTPEKQQADSIEKYKKNFTRWLGELTPEQETLATTMHNKLQDNDALWLEYRETYQAELKKLFEDPAREEAFSKNLFQLLIEPEVFRSNKLNQVNDENSVTFKNILLEINTSTTEQQRQTLSQKINKFAQDAEALIKN